MSDWLQKELQKLQILKQDGVVTEQQYLAKEEYLRQNGQPAQGGVGMLLSDTAPFKVLRLTQGGPAERTHHIQIGDILQAVDGKDMTRVSGDLVREAIIGPAGSVVELLFQELPKRTAHGAYAVKIKRAEPNKGGVTQMGSAAAGSQEMRYADDLDQFTATSEKAMKHHYDPIKGVWRRTMIMVSVETSPFASGAMRDAYRMKDLSVSGDDSQFVLKISKDPKEDTQIYYEDVKMQMEAKMYADMYNRCDVPKKVDFLAAYVLELIERPRKPICGVEQYIAGEYKKYNNNWDWSDDKRNTPQAFSHFTLERSNRQLLICDIQGVGDLWTDPQIHSANDQGYGKGNMGPKGIKTFLQNHKCNVICQHLGLPSTGRVKRQQDFSTMVIPPDQMTRINNSGGGGGGAGAPVPAPAPSAAGGGGGVSSAESERRMREMEARQLELDRKEKEIQQRERDLAAKYQREIERERNESGQVAREVEALQAMGFSRQLAERALANANDLQDAVEWCILNQQQAEPQPVPRSTQRRTVTEIREKGRNRLAKELEAIKKSASNEDQVFLSARNGDNGDLLLWDAVIVGPDRTPYEGGAFHLILEVPEDYPMNPPKVTFRTPVYHPNVWGRNDERFGEICMDTLSSAWSPAIRLQQIMTGLQSLLDAPASDSALDPIVGKMCREEPQQFREFARNWTRQYAVDANQVRKMCKMGFGVDRVLATLERNPSNLDQALAELLEGVGGGVGQQSSVSSSGSGSGRGGGGAGRRAPPGYDAAAAVGSPNYAQQQARLAEQQRVSAQVQQHNRNQQQHNGQAPPTYEQAAGGQERLPEGWSKHFDPNNNRPYYHNRVTNVTQWNPPEVHRNV